MEWNNRWVVLIASIWLQSCSGIGYVFGSLSPIIKSSLDYNQKQINRLGVAKDIGDSVGLLAGVLCDWLPSWALILVGAVQNIVGYGWLWLIVVHRVPPVHFGLVCILICIGTNGETYFNTAALVSCVRNFSQYRGPVVGILKGFGGLGGAIFTCIYAALYAPDQASFIFMVAVGPTVVAILAMLVIRPLSFEGEDSATQAKKFNFVYVICLLLAVYLLGTIILQESQPMNRHLNKIFAVGLILLLALPLALLIPSAFGELPPSPPHIDFQDEVNQLRLPLIEEDDDVEIAASSAADGKKEGIAPGSSSTEKKPQSGFRQTVRRGAQFKEEALVFSELEDEKETWPEPVRRQRLLRASSRLYRAVAEGAIKIKRKRKGPRRGEDFTLQQALIKADFWLLFFSLACGAGSGLMVIDNLGQISQSLGFPDPHIFVSMISIWNFLGRLGGGYVSEVIARQHALPRPILLAVAQTLMAVGHASLAVAVPGSLYIGSLLVGLGYGSHWAIVPATASELFGLKNFGMLYNFLCMANPTGSLIFSGLIAGTLYDREAQKQKKDSLHGEDALKCEGAVCFRETLFIMTGVCMIGVLLNFVLIARTRRVYSMLYGKQRDQDADDEGRTRLNNNSNDNNNKAVSSLH